MGKATYYVNYKVLLKNKIFEIKNFFVSLESHKLLKSKLENKGVDLSTQDINKAELSSFTIFNDYPKRIKKIPINSYLILWESEVVVEENWLMDKHVAFNKIFTWKDDLVDNVKYFKFFFPHDLKINYQGEPKNKFICMICSDKKSNHKNELYSERKKIIDYYEKNDLDIFQFYGYGWDKYNLNKRYLNYIFKKTRMNSFFKTNYKNYKGVVKNKSKILNSYKFSFCLENAMNYDGYITEKIFDCFTSLTIPVYKGPSNVLRFIPKECFINYDDFESLGDLEDYLKSLTEIEIKDYQNSIKIFLNSKESDYFSNNHFVKTIMNGLCI